MTDFTLDKLEKAAQLVYQHMLPTPQFNWPQLCDQLEANVWVKHENHTATGAFKIRGGLTYINWLAQTYPAVKGIVTATRGNHGQSQARAASASNLSAKILVPFGNSTEKNIAMLSFGAEVIEFGQDFEAAKSEAIRLSESENLHIVPPFHPQIVLGVASYALELFSSVSDLDIVYVPIGCGSGICGLIKVRDALRLKTKIVGVVSSHADAAKQSFEAGSIIETSTAHTFADGMAVKSPIEEAFQIYAKGADRIISVSDDEVSEAIRVYFSCTHNVAEGAGAASLAAALQEKEHLKHKKIALILTGGNIDTDKFSAILHGNTPLI